jgi:MerR family transcriptional regulator, light-induced transcriptional regulator
MPMITDPQLPVHLYKKHGQMFTIGDVAARSGVPEGTLRMWERRHGFPAPERLASGHRRYSEREVELVRRVADARASGVTLAAAIERVRRVDDEPPASVYAALRRTRPDLAPRLLPKPIMIALSHAIEDESLSRAERPLLFGAFQRERFYRRAESRWRAFARQAGVAIVFADFPRARTSRAPAELPVDRDHPMSREWAIVCDAPGHAACLAGWEPPGSGQGGRPRVFEAVWSVEPEIVRAASRVCAALASANGAGLLAPVMGTLRANPAPPAADQLRLATAITARALAHLASGAPAAG